MSEQSRRRTWDVKRNMGCSSAAHTKDEHLFGLWKSQVLRIRSITAGLGFVGPVNPDNATWDVRYD